VNDTNHAAQALHLDPIRIELSEEEILADLAYPAPRPLAPVADSPSAPGASARGPTRRGSPIGRAQSRPEYISATMNAKSSDWRRLSRGSHTVS
jgi:hypothetical protein